MQRWTNSASFLVLLGVTVLAIAGAGFLHFDPLCGERTIVEKMSPDGKYVAVLMERSCGATTPYVRHINLHRRSSKLRSGFFDGTVKDGEVFVSAKYNGEHFCWSGSKKLLIGYPDVSSRHWRDILIDSDYRNPECQ